MAKLSLRQRAIDDLNEIWKYTAEKWSEKQADKYYAMLALACRQLAENPGARKSYERISEKLLGLRIGRHIIFYQEISGNEIEIIRILHARMDLKSRLDA